MAIGAAIRQVRTLFDTGTMGALTDPELLDRFLNRDGEAAELAFAALIERHRSMVMRVCRRVLDNPDDVMDAFQTTFLVLATKAKSVRRRDSLASWLYGVSIRVARCARAASIKRKTHERRCARESPILYESEPEGPGAIVHEEFGRLPEHYHAPMVLCDLEDLTHEEAAKKLGWPVGTVKSRLSRGRARLRERLTRRGLVGGSLIGACPPALSPALIDAMARTATKVASGQKLAGMVPASIEALLQGVRRMMIRDMIRNGCIAAVAFGLFTAGAAIAQQPPTDPQVKPAWLASPLAAPPFNRLVTNEIHFFEMNGLDWKEAISPKLRLVKTSPGFRVWTGEAGVLGELRKRMKGEIQAPRVTAEENGLATVNNTHNVFYAASVTWVGTKNSGHGGFQPTVGKVQNGTVVSVSGRKIDQGMLVRVHIDNKKLLGLDAVPVRSPVTEVPITAVTHKVRLNQLQQEGEWLIPNGELLVLSVGHWHEESPPKKTDLYLLNELLDGFGYYDRVAEKNYWSSPVIERLVVIDAKSLIEPINPQKNVNMPTLPNPLPGFFTTQGASQ